jgi:hypothetical protein
LTTRSVLEKFAAVQMVDVQVPTTDGRELTFTRYTRNVSITLRHGWLETKLPLPPSRIG